MDIQMPNVPTLQEYRTIYHRDDVWRPVIETICRRYPFLDEPCVRGPDGTHIVYLVGRMYVVKLFVPLFAQDFVAEHLVGKHLAGRLGVQTPTIVAEGEISGWHYLVMTRIAGRPLEAVWDDVPPANRQRIAAEVGRMIARLRAVSVAGLESLAVDWDAFLAAQAATAPARHRGTPGLTWDPVQEIPVFLASLAGLRGESFAPVLLMADITQEHVFVARRDGWWRVVGYVDFGDALVGHPDYELLAPGLDIARGDRELLRALLLAAGYPESALDQAFCRRLMAYTLVHRYVKLADVLDMTPQAHTAASLEELARMVWPVC